MAAILVLEGAALEAANQIYRTLGFALSTPPRDVTYGVLGATGMPVALGRLSDYRDDGVCELGGIWVDRIARGQGVARVLSKFLLTQAPRSRRVYCLPLVHLAPFYESLGFEPVARAESLPSPIAAKIGECKQKHAQGKLGAACVLVLRPVN